MPAPIIKTSTFTFSDMFVPWYQLLPKFFDKPGHRLFAPPCSLGPSQRSFYPSWEAMGAGAVLEGR